MNNKTIAVFSGSRTGKLKEYSDLAYNLGAKLAAYGYSVVNGGGAGLMESLASGVASLDGKMISVQYAFEGATQHQYSQEVHSFDSLAPRQAKIVALGDAYMVLPGGIGTLYEAIEILAKKQAGEMAHDVPLIFVGTFWSEQFSTMEHIVAKEFASCNVLEFFDVQPDAKSAVDLLNQKFAMK